MSIAAKIFRATASRADKKRDEGLETPDDILRIDNISYGEDPRWHLLDVYRPKSAAGPLPVIIDIHGGGWVYGDKDLYQYYCMSLAQHGFAVVNFSYRLAPKHRFPSSLEDINAVVQFVYDHAGQFGFDTRNLFFVADSAGAHMAAVYACICTDPGYAQRYSLTVPEDFVPRAMVLNCGVYDLGVMLMGNHQGHGLIRDLLGHAPTDEEVDLLSPAAHITADFPPCFVMTSTGDFLRTQPEYLIPELRKHGVEHVSRVYGTEEEKLLHVFNLNVRDMVARACTGEEMIFLHEHEQ